MNGMLVCDWFGQVMMRQRGRSYTRLVNGIKHLLLGGGGSSLERWADYPRLGLGLVGLGVVVEPVALR